MNKIVKNKLDFIGEVFLGLFLFIYIFIAYIKSTIALNYILMLFFLVMFIIIYKRKSCDSCQYLNMIKTPLIFILLFIVWIILQPIIVAEDYSKVINEVRGQFLVPFLFFIFGIFFVVLNYSLLTAKKIFNLVFFAGLSHILLIATAALSTYVQVGTLPIRNIYLLPVDEVSYLTNIIYALFLSEVYSRIIYSKKVLYLSNFMMYGIFLLIIFSVYLQGMRWGVITVTFSSMTFLVFLVYQIRISVIKKIIVFFCTLSIFGGLITSSIQYDKRWDTVFETIEIVLKNDSLYWVNQSLYPCPKLKNGNCVNESNYIRPAQQINGYKMVLDYPLGVGYSRYAYQTALNLKYNNTSGTFSFPHSGILNLIIGVGIPGIILYFIFFYMIIKILLKLEFSYYKVFTIFLILAFHLRSFVDMTFMNHNLKVFMLLLGIGLFSAILDKEKNNTKQVLGR